MRQPTRLLAVLAAATLVACERPESSPGSGAPVPDPGVLRSLATAGGTMFTNGDFEADAVGATPPTGWTVQNYLNSAGVSGTSSAPPSSFAALNLSGLGTAVNETFVVGGATQSQVDPDLGAGQAFRFPAYDARAARVNYKDLTVFGKNKNSNLIRQSMTVGLTDVDPADGQIHVRFAVAPVLENPSHAFNQQPYFFIELLNLTRGTSLYSAFNVAGQAGVPWRTTTSVRTGNATQWLDWQLIDIAPGNAALTAGDVVQLTVVASGCSLGGHFGRIYVDGIGAFIPGPFVAASAPQSVNAGGTLTYTLTYSNGGTSAAVGARVDLVTPPKTTFASVSGAPAACTVPAVGSAGTISCPLGTLAAGASGSFTVTVNVSASATGTIVNGNYSISAINATTLLGAKTTTTVISSGTATADIAVVKTAGFAAVQPGQSIPSSGTPLYTITITNNSPTYSVSTFTSPSATFTFSDAIPAQVTGVTWACTVTAAGTGSASKCKDKNGASGTTINGNGSAITLKPRLGANGGQVTVKVYGTLSASASGTLVNTASGSLSGLTDSNPANNSSTVSTPVGTTTQTLTVTKAGTGAGTVASAPAGIACGATCAASVVTDSQVVLTASPTGSASFSGWSGAGAPAACTTGTPRTCTVTMSAAKPVTATFTAAPAVGAPAALHLYSGSGQLASTSATFTDPLRVLVTDANGAPVSGATVAFTATPSGGGASATLSAGTATTNASGIASLTATANAVAGSYTVSATLAALTPAVFTLTNVGPPASITYVNGGNATDPQLAPLSTAFAASLVAQVKDAAGNVIPGVTVTYAAVPAGGASGALSGVTVTDAAGLSSATATANATVGAFTVTASVAGVATPAVFSLQNVSTGPAAIYFVSGSPQTAATSAAYGSPLVVTVADAAGNALPGVTVSFAAVPGASGASVSLSSATAVTDASGLASVTATASATGGPLTVTASVSGVATPATFALTNDGGYSIAVNGGGIQATVINTAYGTALTALVVDTATDTAVSGATVTFVSPSSGPTATLSGDGMTSACVPASSSCRMATTDGSGIATVTATANGLSGSFTVTASTQNAPTTAAYALSNQCTASSQCSATTPICGGEAACLACASDLECSTKDPAKPYCDATGACLACLSDAQCSGTSPICAQATSTCGGCTTDAQCANKDAAAPTCVLATGACSASYTVTASAGANGSISPSGAQTVLSGDSIAFTVTPSAGHHVAGVLVDGVPVGAVTSYTFPNVTASRTIEASFAIDTHTITASAGLDGLVDPPGAVSVNHGADQTFTISPAANHHVDDVLVDGVSVGAVTSYTFPNVTTSHTIEASFAIDTHVVTASSGAHGTITPAGAVSVAHGDDQTFLVDADPSYEIADVLVDGGSVGAVTSYTFSAVSAAHTIEATFEPLQQAATVTIAPASLSATYDGAPKAVSVTTLPPGLTFSVTYDGSTTAPTAAGTYAVVATVTDPGYVGSASGSLVVAKAVPVVAWASPAAITYGAALSATQLDATASTPGSFVYTPASGTVLDAGAGQVLSVEFTPTDSANFTTASGSTTITVNKATPSITWASPAAITYGTALSATQLDATASTPGSFVYTPASGTVLNAGAGRVLSVEFTPTDSANFTTASGSTTITVGKASQLITFTPPATKAYGALPFDLAPFATGGGSGNPVTFTVSGGPATLAGSTLDITGAGTVFLAADQAGDADHDPAPQVQGSVEVGKAASTIALATSESPSVYGASATFTATLGGPGGTPTGTVTFSDGTATLCGPVAAVDGVAACSTSALSSGVHDVTAIYAGDANHLGSSATEPQVVAQGEPTVVLLSTPAPSVHGQDVALTVAVTGAGATPTGTVTLTEGGAILCGGPLALSGGLATCHTATLPVGVHELVAAYSGDDDHGTGAPSTRTHTVERALTAVALDVTPATAVFGEPVVLTATITVPSPGAGSPGGTVDFLDGTTLLGTATVDPGTGIATLTVPSPLATGDHDLTVIYGGDGSFQGALSPALATFSVGPASTLVAITPSRSPSVSGELVTFSVDVTAVSPGAGTPSGTVELSVDGGAPVSVALYGGAGSFTAALAAGAHTVDAAYVGDASFLPASTRHTQAVDLAAAAVAVAASPAPSIAGQPVAFVVTVGASSPGSGTPGGTVTLRVGLTPLASATLDGTGRAVIEVADLPAGDHALFASYGGDARFLPGDAPLDHTVQRALTETALAVSDPAPAFGAPVTLSATVTPAAFGLGVPTGDVVFLDGVTVLGIAALDAGGTARLDTSALEVGLHALAAEYAGDASFAGSRGTATQGVQRATVAVAVVASPSPSEFGEPVTVTVTLTTPVAGAGIPGGTVTLRDGQTAVGTATADAAGVATFTLASPAAGLHPLVASYGGDAAFSAGEGSADLTVGASPTALAVASSRNPSRAGQPVTFTATATSAHATPEGTVTFTDGDTELGTAALVDGVARLTTRTLRKGNHPVGAQLAASARFAAASGALAGGQVVENTPPVAGSGRALRLGPGHALRSTAAAAGALDRPTGTIELWARATWTAPDEVGATPTLARLGDATGARWALGVAPDRGHLTVTLGDAISSIPAELSDGAWHQVALLAGEAGVTVVLDGVEVGAVDGPLGAGPGETLTVGDGFTGEVDELRVWSATRTVAEVAADARRPLLGSEPGLLSCWRMDDETGLERLDAGPAALELAAVLDPGTPAADAQGPSGAWRRRVATRERPLAPIDAGYDADGDALGLSVTLAPAHGTASVDLAQLQVGYLGADGFAGDDRLTFRLIDADGTTGDYTVDVEVDRILGCEVDADCSGGDLCLQQTCVAPDALVARAGGCGCTTGGGGALALWSVLALALTARRRPRRAPQGGRQP